MPVNITMEFVQQLLEQNTALLKQNTVLTDQVDELNATVRELNQTIRELKEQLSKNSNNSSKPPSFLGFYVYILTETQGKSESKDFAQW